VKARRATAGRYAKALFEIARETGQIDVIGRDLAQFQEVFATEPALQGVLLRPWIKPEDRHAVATEIAARAGCSRAVQGFLGLVASRARMDHLTEIVEAYRDLADKAAGQVRATVRTAVPLTDEDKRQLAARLGQRLGKTVLLEETVDKNLLGGFVAEIGSLILDGSVNGQLQRMRERLLRG